MSKKKIKISVVQMKSLCGDFEANLNRSDSFVVKASKEGSKIVCLPELFDTGYDLKWISKNVDKTFPKTKSFLSELALRKNIYIIAGVANKRAGKLFNSSFVFSPDGKIAGRYDKNFLFRAKPQEEHKYFVESSRCGAIDTEFGKIGLVICNDIRYPELFKKQALQGARVIFVSSAWGLARLNHWKSLLPARAIENQVYIAASNQTGKAGDITLAGHSMIVDFDGNVLKEAKRSETLLTTEIDFKAQDKKRKELPTFKSLKK